MEGGSWNTILHTWTYYRYKCLHEEWRQRPNLRSWAKGYFGYKPRPKQLSAPNAGMLAGLMNNKGGLPAAIGRQLLASGQGQQQQPEEEGVVRPGAQILDFLKRQPGGKYKG